MVIDIGGWIQTFTAGLQTQPRIYQHIFTVAFFMILIFLYSIFVWKVYRAISRKDIISLNLQQYNSFEHPTLQKLWAGFLYLIEYIIVLPFLILFWYVIFALALLFFSEDLSIEQVLLLSAAVVGAIRLLAYYKHDLATEVAKLLPLTILGLMLLSPGFLNASRFVESISQVPSLLFSLGYILAFVAGLEIVLRVLDLFKRIIVDN